jgi:hypothetical protein
MEAMTATTHATTDPASPFTHAGDVRELPRVALYEHAAGLLAVAGALQAAAHQPGAAAALSPTLACLEASLEALADAADRLGVHAVEHLFDADSSPAESPVARAEAQQRFKSVVDALQRARAECAFARVAVGPARSCARDAAWDGL